MTFWQWLKSLFVGLTPVPLAPHVIEMLAARTGRRRVFLVLGVPTSREAFLLVDTLVADGPRDRSLTVRREDARWHVTVDFHWPHSTQADLKSSPGDPLTTDALRQLCAGAGTDGAVTFTSEGGFHLTPLAVRN